MTGAVGWAAAIGAVVAAIVAGIVALIGHAWTRRATREAQKRWEIDYANANMRWLQDGREQLERWQAEQRQARETWERDRSLTILHHAVQLTCATEETSRRVGQAQLRSLLRSGLVQDDDRALLEATAMAALGTVLQVEVDEVRVDLASVEPIVELDPDPGIEEEAAGA